MPTFGRGLRTVRGNLSHTGSVAAERHQAGDDGGLAEADVANDRHAAVGACVGAVEVGVDLLEEPLAAREDGVHGDAGHFEQQRFEGDVLRPVGGKTHWGRGGNYGVRGQVMNIILESAYSKHLDTDTAQDFVLL